MMNWLVLGFVLLSVSCLQGVQPFALGGRKHGVFGGGMMAMMFSGIVEDIGTVDNLVIKKDMILWDGSIGEVVELTVKSKVALEEAYLGCSIAVNGVCLTVISYDDEKFTVGLAPETLRRSNLGLVGSDSKVNVERALRADSRNSGHFVQGHVDGTGRIMEKYMEGDSLWIKVAVTRSLAQYMVPKGFVAVDGTSLTLCDVETGKGDGSSSSSSTTNTNSSTTSSTTSSSSDERDCYFTLMLIRHTQETVIFPSRVVGDLVNIEVDVLAKMVETSASSAMAKAVAAEEEAKQLRVEVDILRAELESLRYLLREP